MKRKLLRQILSQWRSNVWLTVELVIITVVTWFIVDLMAQIYIPMAEPKGFDIEHCYKLTLTESDDTTLAAGMTDIEAKRELLRRLRAYPGVEALAISSQGAEPYAGSLSSAGIIDASSPDSVQYGMTDAGSIRFTWANPDFIRVFRIKGFRGESTEEMADRFGSDANGLFISGEFVNLVDSGHRVPDPYTLLGHEMRIHGRGHNLNGIIANVKRTDDTPLSAFSIAIAPIVESDDSEIASMNEWWSFTIRVRPETDRGFADRFRAEMAHGLRAGQWYVADITPFSTVRAVRMSSELKAVKKFYLILGFLMVNVFLGILGTFWYRTRRRVPELAVRMSFGATRVSLFRRLMGEGLIILAVAATLAVAIIAMLISVDVRPTVGWDRSIDIFYAVSTLAATLAVMMLMIFLGIWFPARSAMKVNPATALHDD